MSNEKERLQKELDFLSNLIKEHKSKGTTVEESHTHSGKQTALSSVTKATSCGLKHELPHLIYKVKQSETITSVAGFAPVGNVKLNDAELKPSVSMTSVAGAALVVDIKSNEAERPRLIYARMQSETANCVAGSASLADTKLQLSKSITSVVESAQLANCKANDVKLPHLIYAPTLSETMTTVTVSASLADTEPIDVKLLGLATKQSQIASFNVKQNNAKIDSQIPKSSTTVLLAVNNDRVATSNDIEQPLSKTAEEKYRDGTVLITVPNKHCPVSDQEPSTDVVMSDIETSMSLSEEDATVTGDFGNKPIVDITCLLAGDMVALYRDKMRYAGDVKPSGIESTRVVRMKPPSLIISSASNEFINCGEDGTTNVTDFHTLVLPDENASSVVGRPSWQVANRFKLVKDCHATAARNSRRIVVTTGAGHLPFTETLLVTTVNAHVSSGGVSSAAPRFPNSISAACRVKTSSPHTHASAPMQFRVSTSTSMSRPDQLKPASKMFAPRTTADGSSVTNYAAPFVRDRYKLVRKIDGATEPKLTTKPVGLSAHESTTTHTPVPYATRQGVLPLRASSLVPVNRYKLVQQGQLVKVDAAVVVPPPEHLVPKTDKTLCECEKKSGVISSPYKLVRNSSVTSLPVSRSANDPVGIGSSQEVSLADRFKIIRKRNALSSLNPNPGEPSSKLPCGQSPSLIRGSGSSNDSSIANAKSVVSSKPTPRLLCLNKYKLVRKRSAVAAKQFSPPTRRSSASRPKDFSDCQPTRRRSLRRRSSSCKKSIASFSSKYALQNNSHDDENELDINRILGRKVKNLSHSMYKFVNGNAVTPQSATTLRQRRTCGLPKNSQLKIDRRSSLDKRVSRRRSWRLLQPQSFSWRRRRSSSSASTPLTRNRRLSVRNFPPMPGMKGKRAGSFDAIMSSWRTSAATLVAQRIINQRCWRWSAADQRRKASAQARTYCMFFNRFGRCSRGDACQYVHDPDKVSVCTRFLRGTCKVIGCPFSHHVAPDKMPTCRYFLRGICSHDACPYRHVKTACNAGPCLDFARGYCHLGDACKKNHVLICPEFTMTGECPRGKRCPLRHSRKSTSATTVGCIAMTAVNRAVAEDTKDEVKCVELDQVPKSDDLASDGRHRQKLPDDGSSCDDHDNDDINLPMKHRRLPSFIAINTTDGVAVLTEQVKDAVPAVSSASTAPLSIRPRLPALALPLVALSGSCGDDDDGGISWLSNL